MALKWEITWGKRGIVKKSMTEKIDFVFQINVRTLVEGGCRKSDIFR